MNIVSYELKKWFCTVQNSACNIFMVFPQFPFTYLLLLEYLYVFRQHRLLINDCQISYQLKACLKYKQCIKCIKCYSVLYMFLYFIMNCFTHICCIKWTLGLRMSVNDTFRWIVWCHLYGYILLYDIWYIM